MFWKGPRLFSPSFEPIEIPYEGTMLPGYFYRTNHHNSVRGARTSRPTIIVHGGFDSTLEELYASAVCPPALDRGYNCLTFEGPGQGGVIRKQKIPFRYDWEKVVTPVMDYALSRKEIVDPKSYCTHGNKHGRLFGSKSLLLLKIELLPACYTMESMMDMMHLLPGFPQSLRIAVENGDVNVVNTVTDILSDIDTNMRFNLKHGMWISYWHQYAI